MTVLNLLLCFFLFDQKVFLFRICIFPQAFVFCRYSGFLLKLNVFIVQFLTVCLWTFVFKFVYSGILINTHTEAPTHWVQNSFTVALLLRLIAMFAFLLDFRWPFCLVILSVVFTPPGTTAAGLEGWTSLQVLQNLSEHLRHGEPKLCPTRSQIKKFLCREKVQNLQPHLTAEEIQQKLKMSVL